ncbi:NAD-dependent epimerase/dehydratase family protein [Vampirovibrio chlorellavorus]|uniref:NAD-dependent epimerase/dehydratase family protein n=1 Tax=Vampirovibrio chlorellavorus TaxID=758823 RepID=UPI0026EAA9B6|nr:NAD-dependent epimerase/dehydratase family protein [Vampirovibrio chlorellavorus]
MTKSERSGMNCLVTGGAGFVGSHLVDALVSEGHRVSVFDNLSTGKRHNILQHGGKVEFIQGDIRDMPALTQACRDQDIIFHKAAIASVSESVRDPQSTYEVNILGTGNVFEAAGQAGVKHLVFASSAAVYGPVEYPECHEGLLPQPASQYGLSKLVGEQYGQFYSRFNHMQVTCLRYFNIYGARQSQSSDYAGVISLFIGNLLSNRNLTVFGNGKQTRDFVNVADVVQANLKALANTGQYPFEVLNIGSGQKRSLLDLIECLRALGFQNFEVAHRPERRGDLRHSLSSIEKARTLLGFCPSVAFKDGLAEVVEYIRCQKGSCGDTLQAGEPLVNYTDKACNA